MDVLDSESCIDAVSRCSINTSTQFCTGHFDPSPLWSVYIAPPDSDANGDTDSCTEKTTMGANGMALGVVLNGHRTHLSRPRSQSRSVETYPNITIKPNSLCLSLGIGTGIDVG